MEKLAATFVDSVEGSEDIMVLLSVHTTNRHHENTAVNNQNNDRGTVTGVKKQNETKKNKSKNDEEGNKGTKNEKTGDQSMDGTVEGNDTLR